MSTAQAPDPGDRPTSAETAVVPGNVAPEVRGDRTKDVRRTDARRRSKAIKVVGGLVAVLGGLFVVLVISVLAIAVVSGDTGQIATIAAASFGVVGTIVGAYFGVKVGTDQSQQALRQTQHAMGQTQDTIRAMREEASKAQAFAAHLPPPAASAAMRDARLLIDLDGGGQTRERTAPAEGAPPVSPPPG